MEAVETHILWLMLVSVLCIVASTVLAYMSRWQAIALSLAALLSGYFSGYVAVEPSVLWFWAAASLIAVGIVALLPDEVRRSRVGLPYFCTGALVGMSLGMLLNSSAGIISGSALGVLLAAVAYSRTPGGSKLDFPSRKFFNYLCAKGLPLVVVFSMAGICILLIVSTAKLSG